MLFSSWHGNISFLTLIFFFAVLGFFAKISLQKGRALFACQHSAQNSEGCCLSCNFKLTSSTCRLLLWTDGTAANQGWRQCQQRHQRGAASEYCPCHGAASALGDKSNVCPQFCRIFSIGKTPGKSGKKTGVFPLTTAPKRHSTLFT